MHDLFSVKDKVVFITGSSRGIGFSLAEEFAKLGAKVIINGSNVKRVEQAVGKLQEKKLCAFPCAFDVTNEDAVVESIASLHKNFSIDVLINNAGVQERVEFLSCDLKTWRNVMDVNVDAAFLISREIVKVMKDRKKGKVINICSLLSDFGRSSIVPYTVSKGAIKMLTKGMATELSQFNIQVNGVAPGYFLTEMNTSLANDQNFSDWLVNRTPAGRWGEVKELTGACLLFASEASSFITGQVIFVDGGISASL